MASPAGRVVDQVLMVLGLQPRHLRREGLRWPQLLAVPPANVFQLAAFLASEEVSRGFEVVPLAFLLFRFAEQNLPAGPGVCGFSGDTSVLH